MLAVCTQFLFKPAITGGKPLVSVKSVLMALLSALAKGIVMGLTISLWVIPTFLPAESPLRGKLGVFQTTFSVTQFITACIGFVYVFIIWIPLRKTLKEM